MKKAHDILAEVNDLRAQLNKKPLASWKGSTSDLLAVKRSLKEALAKAVIVEAVAAQPQTTPTPAVAPRTKKQRTTKTAAPVTGDIATFAQAFDAAGIAAKIARAKLRKAHGSAWKDMTPQAVLDFLKR